MQLVAAPTIEASDLACIGTARAEEIAGLVGVAALVAVATAWRVRDRVAEQGHGFLWALSSLLVGVFQTVATLAMVAPGCATAHTFGWMVGCASPWVLAAGYLRSGVAPPPPPLGRP